MAKPILTTPPLSDNEIDYLTELFNHAFLRLNELDIFSTQAQRKRLFLEQLHIMIGLAFTAVLVEQNSLALFTPYLNNFLRYQVNNTNMDSNNMAMGDIISLGNDAFRTLEYPEYHHYFLQALHDSLRYINTELKIPISSDLSKVMTLIKK